MFADKRYDAVLKELYGFKRLGIRPALGPTRKFLKALGNPEKKIPCFHVAGTNGKGSTTAMIASILKEAGYKTGAYYSPHISDFRERFLINGRFCPKNKVLETLLWMAGKYEKARMEPLTFFEWGTALAFCLFAREKVDVAVIETGMGGNFDATNLVSPLVSVITNVSLEHTSILGKTIRDISAEKAGIIKSGKPVVCGDHSSTVREVVRKAARTKRSPAFFLETDFKISKSGLFTAADGKKYLLAPSMSGEYQLKNSALAVQAVLCAKKLRVKAGQIEAGIKNAFLPGRFEVVEKEGREIIFDVAHNPAAIRELAKILKSRGGKYDFIFGVLADKDFRKMLKTLAPLARRMYCVAPDDERALPAKTLCIAARDLGINATAAEFGKIPFGGRTCVTGSFTTVEAAKKSVTI